MREPRLISSGARVRCRAESGAQGPRAGWLGTVLEVDCENGSLLVTIAWDALRGNRAKQRQRRIPLHLWAFQDEQLAADYLEVVSVELSGNG